MPGVPGRAGVGLGCRFQEGVHGAFRAVFPEKVVLCAPIVVVPFLLLPPLEGRVVRWEVSLDGIGSTAWRPWDGLGCRPVWRRCPLGGGGGGMAARSGSFWWCSAFWSAVDAGDMERGGMGWSGSCGSVACWWACGRGAVVASRCRMAGRKL